MGTFTIDHDLHIHSQLSLCSSDPGQTTGAILGYAKKNGLSTICLTDHFWDPAIPGASEWYAIQNTEHIKKALPLPQAENVRFLFGCETEMDKYFTIGISGEMIDSLDFVIVPTTHLHMEGFTLDASVGYDEDGIKRRRELYIERFSRLLSADLPFHKIGVAHLTCSLACHHAKRGMLRLLEGISDQTFAELFSSAARKGLGIELNFDAFKYEGEDKETVYRPYRIAKACGCKFYLGSDAHHPGELDKAADNFREIVNTLGLDEDDKFRLDGR
ncbi:MAG: PHP domain-containing protein [Clostridia bacterium]|nr:PHP domain-containing protein [Clostridia bacterium]